MTSGDPGRVPAGEVELLRASVENARQIASTLPSQAPMAWAEVAYSTCLTFMLRDWVENGNGEGMLPDDVQDLEALVSMAATIALEQDFDRRDSTFRIVVQAALEDWLKNWNADDSQQ